MKTLFSEPERGDLKEARGKVRWRRPDSDRYVHSHDKRFIIEPQWRGSKIVGYLVQDKESSQVYIPGFPSTIKAAKANVEKYLANLKESSLSTIKVRSSDA